MSKRPRYALTPMADKNVALFHSADEAWFWFIRCQTVRHHGGRPTASMHALIRPCDPDDIYRIVISLHKQASLSAAHLRTLSQFGLAERTPDGRCLEEAAAARLWGEAMGYIESRLRAKNLLEPDALKAS